MTNTAVLFDFDGTLFFGTTDINYHTFNLALAEMGRPPITREVANTTVGDKIPDVCRRLRSNYVQRVRTQCRLRLTDISCPLTNSRTILMQKFRLLSL